MIYPESLKNEVEELLSLLNENISTVELQGGQNLGLAYALRAGLEELLTYIEKNISLDRQFIMKWNRVMTYCPRFFEGESILDSINAIDKKIIPGNLRLI